jgi:hypothetical protein
MGGGINVAGTSQYILSIPSNAQTLNKRYSDFVEPLLPSYWQGLVKSVCFHLHE